jgi:hypothetical protein
MKKWKFFSINDIKKEPHKILFASSVEEAIGMASSFKKLSIQDFNNLFIVEEII